MTEIDWDRIKKLKDEHRARVTARPIGEKLHLLELLRERASALRPSRTLLRLDEVGAMRVRRGQIAQAVSGDLRVHRFGANSVLISSAGPQPSSGIGAKEANVNRSQGGDR